MSQIRSTREGFTLIEILIVIVIIGIVLATALPKFSSSRSRNAVHSAATDIAQALSTARNSAVRRGRAAQFILSGTSILVVSGTDTIVRPRDLSSVHAVSLTSSPTVSTVTYDARGLANMSSTISRIIVTRDTWADTVCISKYGGFSKLAC